MHDPILDDFLQQSHDDAMALAAASDLLDLEPLAGSPPTRFIAHFKCRGLVYRDNEVRQAEQFALGLSFSRDYLQAAPQPLRMLTWLGPHDVHHPNIRGSFICLGNMPQGTDLVALLHQCFEIVTYQRVTMREDDALNAAACAWARRHVEMLPIDPRPLKWRRPRHEAEATRESL